jgi:predicted nucleotidyltransferase component of viral defense system
MIDILEIDSKAEELGVHRSNVQRDYAFGWLLSSFYHPESSLKQSLILKGGNCFRKAYFEHARYSNDLDFSTLAEVDPDRLLDGIREACVLARRRSGIEFLVDESRVAEKRMSDGESRMFEARVYFHSFYGDEDLRLRVNLDVKEFDAIFLPIQTRKLIHSYSDADACQADLKCMKLEELLASKLKALLQRRHSPDLYDFVHSLFFQKALAISRREVLTTFLKQTIYEPSPAAAKGLLLQLPFNLIRGFWNEYLACPKLALFSFEDAEKWFKTIVNDIFALAEPRPMSVDREGGFSLSSFPASLRDTIMEGGRLTRILRLVYGGYERLVEPYALSFKRPKDGIAREYFYAWDRTGGSSGQIGIKSFLPDKVQSVELTEESFVPRYPIELTKGDLGYFGKPFSSGLPATFSRTLQRPTRRQITTGYSTTYTVECSYCGKRFKRNSYDTKLNEHKDKYGNRCFGRVGHIV